MDSDNPTVHVSPENRNWKRHVCSLPLLRWDTEPSGVPHDGEDGNYNGKYGARSGQNGREFVESRVPEDGSLSCCCACLILVWTGVVG